MKNSIWNYSNFLTRITIKKKSTVIIPAVLLIISLILSITLFSVKIPTNFKDVLIYIYAILMLLFTVLYASIKALNIFKDGENEGTDLLTIAKPISRYQFAWGKTLSFLFLGLIWSLATLLGGILVFSSLLIGTNLAISILLSFFVIFLGYLFFGSITSLIASKWSQKIALTIPLLIFAPLAIGGSIISINSVPRNENVATLLNRKYAKHNSNKELDAEEFYLNNNKDKFYLMNNGLNNDQFTEKQQKYIDKVLEMTKTSSTAWQTYSWLSVPYQMVDIFNINNKNIFNQYTNTNKHQLNNYLYYNNLENTIYNYKLNKTPDLLKVRVSKDATVKYVVPGMMKVNSKIDKNQTNTSIIFARENADNFDVHFDEENFSFYSPKNLVGKLDWDITYDILENKLFNIQAKAFYDNFLKNNNISDISESNLKVKILEAISNEVNNQKSNFYKIDDKNNPVFDVEAIKNGKLESETQRKIYIATALINWLYFNNNDSDLLKAILKNKDKYSFYNPSQLKLKIDNYNYYIGGYESYETKNIVVDGEDGKQKVVLRFDLKKQSKNTLFQVVDEKNALYSIERDSQVVNKNIYFIIWIIISAGLIVANVEVYRRKDYN